MSVLKKIGPVLLFLAGCAHLSAGTVDLQLSPLDGAIAGLPGDHIGWGFTITNNSGLWLFFTSSTLDSETNPGLLANYTDYMGINNGNDTLGPLPVVDNNLGTTWTATYSFLSQTGVGDYQIDPGAGIGLSDSGTITIYYQGFDCNPNVCSPNETDGTASAAFSVSTQTPASTVPEPASTVPLAVSALGWAGLLLRRRFAK
jgi:hypothetical protein